ncbi:MAG: hypothetical protein VX620_15415 [Pseudomonadota bacterium]|nr:hypothetical protein [Pseudomonadota bacterium]
MTYEVSPIVHKDLVIGGFAGKKLKGCKSLAIAQAIAAHVITDALIECESALKNSPDKIKTETTFDCFTEMVQENNTFVIANHAELDGKLSVKTSESGTIDFGISGVQIPRARLNEQPDNILISEVSQRLQNAINAISLECEPLKNAIDGHEVDVRKIAVGTPLPDSVLERIR